MTMRERLTALALALALTLRVLLAAPAAALVALAAPEAAPELAAVAPVAAMRASRSAGVVQVTVVPAESTSGRAAHLGHGQTSAWEVQKWDCSVHTFRRWCTG